MDSMMLWDVLKALVVPLVGGLMYFVRKNFTRLDAVEKDLQDQKVKTAVIESKVDDIRDDIKEIKFNVEKLVERK